MLQRLKLPLEYRKLDFPERQQYLERCVAELAYVSGRIDDLRSQERQNVLPEMADMYPDLPQLKAKKRRTFKGQREKISASVVVPQAQSDPTNRSIVSLGNDGTLIVWDHTTGLKTEALSTSSGHSLCLAAAPSGRMVAAGGLSCTVAIYSINEELNRLLEQPREPYLIQETDQSTLQDDATRLFGGITGSQPKAVHQETIAPAARSPTHSATPVTPVTYGTSLQPQQFRAKLGGHRAAVTCCAFTAETTMISGDGDGSFVFWDVTEAKALWHSREHSLTVNSVFSGSTSRFLVGTASDDGFAKIWDMRLEKCVNTFSSPTGGPFTVANFHAEGRAIVTADPHHICVHDLRSNSIISKVPIESAPCSMGLSETGRLGIFGHEDGSVQVADILKGRIVSKFNAHSNVVSSISLAGREFITSSWDSTMCSWQF